MRAHTSPIAHVPPAHAPARAVRIIHLPQRRLVARPVRASTALVHRDVRREIIARRRPRGGDANARVRHPALVRLRERRLDRGSVGVRRARAQRLRARGRRRGRERDERDRARDRSRARARAATHRARVCRRVGAALLADASTTTTTTATTTTATRDDGATPRARVRAPRRRVDDGGDGADGTTAATTTATRCVQTSSLARFAAPVRAFSPNAKPRSLETAATKDARRRSRALAHRLAAGGADAGWIF